VLEHGAVRATPNDSDTSEGILLQGKTLYDMAADDYRDAVSAQQSKQLMRMLLNHHLAGKTLHTRELIRDLQKI
jgi:DNA repair protein RecO (recombination protein O)